MRRIGGLPVGVPNVLPLGALLCVLMGGALMLGLARASADVVESSVTVRARHARCEPEVWRHVELSALERAQVYCGTRGGLDQASLRWVHDDSALGNDHICVLHLHFGCTSAV